MRHALSSHGKLAVEKGRPRELETARTEQERRSGRDEVRATGPHLLVAIHPSGRRDDVRTDDVQNRCPARARAVRVRDAWHREATPDGCRGWSSLPGASRPRPRPRRRRRVHRLAGCSGSDAPDRHPGSAPCPVRPASDDWIRSTGRAARWSGRCAACCCLSDSFCDLQPWVGAISMPLRRRCSRRLLVATDRRARISWNFEGTPRAVRGSLQGRT